MVGCHVFKIVIIGCIGDNVCQAMGCMRENGWMSCV